MNKPAAKRRRKIADDLDGPWKEAIETFFPAFVEFFFPEAHTDIDWERGYEFLNKELQQVARGSGFRRRLVDMLVKVWRKDGTEIWVLIHIEVQNQPDSMFERRMYVYNYRLFDRYGRQIASFAVLGDTQEDWRPQSFGYTLWGSRAGLEFPVVKLLDYEADWDALETSSNPFAVIVMAHLKTVRTRRNPQSRLEWKLRLAKALYRRGYNRDDIVKLFRFIEWIMRLPEDWEINFMEEMEEFEEEKPMPFVSSIERRAMRRAMRKELHESLIENLEVRFGQPSETIIAQIQSLEDLERLRWLRRFSIAAQTLKDFVTELDAAEESATTDGE